jgi:hypothetical protein
MYHTIGGIMGLDMYLFKLAKLEKENRDMMPENVIAYFRKANAIHGLIYRTCGIPLGLKDCDYLPVSKQNLEIMLRVCEEAYTYKDVLDRCPQPESELIEIKKLLPCFQGYFFGSYNYDKDYFIDLDCAITSFKEILTNTNFELDDVFYYAWY